MNKGTCLKIILDESDRYVSLAECIYVHFMTVSYCRAMEDEDKKHR